MDDVVAVVTDLFFQSRVLAAARASSRRVRFVSTADQLRSFRLALVDLDARAPVPEMIRALKEKGHGPVVAFGPHLDTEKRKQARMAGADRVLAKSKFVTDLPRLMRSVEGTSQA